MAHTFTDANFSSEVELNKGVVLVDFWAPWCGPCKMQGPIIEDIATLYAGKPNVKIGKMNVDENPNVSQQFQVFSIPTLVLFKDGKPVDQAIGLQSKDSIVQRLNRQIGA